MQLVEPLGAGHVLVDLEEERHLPDQRGDVLGVRAEAEVAVPVGRAGGREHERALGGRAQQMRHLREVIGHELARAGPERGACDRGEEVGDVPQVIAALPVDRRPRVQCVHLVQADAVELAVMCLEDVEKAGRLAVGHRDDHIRAGDDVVEHGFGGGLGRDAG